MIGVFADTSFFVALFQPNDVDHLKAVNFQQRNDRSLVTTQFVLVEVANFFSKMVQRQAFDHLVDHLNQRAVIVPASDQWFSKGHRLFATRPDKQWSLTDCISFVVMKEMGLSDALTADHHFEQAGFTALLK